MSSASAVQGSRRDTATTAPATAPRTAVPAEAIVDGFRVDRPDAVRFRAVRFRDGEVRGDLVRARTLVRWVDFRGPARLEVFFAARVRAAEPLGRVARFARRRCFAPAARFADGFRILADARFATDASFVGHKHTPGLRCNDLRRL